MVQMGRGAAGVNVVNILHQIARSALPLLWARNDAGKSPKAKSEVAKSSDL